MESKVKKAKGNDTPELLYGGPVFEPAFAFHDAVEPANRRPCLSHWVWQYGVTDRVRKPVSVASADA